MIDNEEDSLLHENAGTGMSFRLALAFFACTIGSSFQFGYNTGVVNAPQTVIQSFLNETSIHRYGGGGMTQASIFFWWSSIVSIWIVGGMIGALSGGALADRFGRKKSLLLSNSVLVLGAVLMIVSKYSESGILLAAGRFFAGLHSGVSTCVAPMYLSEVSSLKLRGFAGTLHQLTIVTAILISQLLGLDFILGNEKYWNLLLGFVLIPAAIQLILYPCCPESPRYIYLNLNERERAFQALHWLHGIDGAEREMRKIEHEKETSINHSKMSVWELLKSSSLRMPLFLSIVLQASQQLTGVNVVFYYSTSIFENVGLTHSASEYSTLGTSITNLVVTSLSAILVDRAGRRTLQLVGLGGEWVSAILITVALVTSATVIAMKYVSVVAVFLFIVFFAVGPGSIPWFMVAEMFTQRQRGAAVSVAVFFNWLFNFFVGFSFPFLQGALEVYSFIPFIGVLTLLWIILFFRLPETKNRTVAEINAEIAGQRS